MPTNSKQGKRNLGRTGHRYTSARRKVLANNQICALCGDLIDMDLKYPDPMSATVDHIVSVKQIMAETGKRDDPRLYDTKNLQPAHLRCNSQRKDKAMKRDYVTSENWFE